MKILVTGVGGQLGYDIVHELIRRDHDVIGIDLAAIYTNRFGLTLPSSVIYIPLDITNRHIVNEVIGGLTIDAVIHCAAWTDVDKAEDPSNFEIVRNVNFYGTQYIAELCKKMNIKMIYISTDYVFNGEGNTPWDPDNKNFKPLNFYGQSKLEGEFAVSSLLDKYFIVRIAWVFGKNGTNFIKKIIEIGKNRDVVYVIDDQIGTPTYTIDLAVLLADIIVTEKYGFYHATNEGGFISWYDYAIEIYKQAGLSTKVIPVSSSNYAQIKAARPKNSRLDKSKLVKSGFKKLPTWQDALRRYLEEMI